MTSSNELKKSIETADDVFNEPAPTDEREKGFESDDLDDETIQVRRGCRALVLARALLGKGYGDFLEHQRFFSAAIELSFQAIERSSQAILISANVYQDGQTYSSHERTIRDSGKANVWDQEDADKMAELYQAQRARTYYNDGIPSKSRALAMVGLATEVHKLAVNNRLKQVQCLCPTH